MSKWFYFLITALLFVLPAIARAHGGIDDGHPNGTFKAMDYLELGGIVLISIGLIMYSLGKHRETKNTNHKIKPGQ